MSPFYVEATAGFVDEKIIGPLLFLNIDGERHFFPSS
jgi:hypothetical protein